MRIGDVIQRAKYEYYNMKAKSIDPMDVINNPNSEGYYAPDETTIEAAVNEITPIAESVDPEVNPNHDPSENIGTREENETDIPKDADQDSTKQQQQQYTGDDNTGNDKKSYTGFALDALDTIETKLDDWFGGKSDVDVDEGNLQSKTVDADEENVNLGVPVPEITQTQNDKEIESSIRESLDNTESDNNVDNHEEYANLDEDFDEETYNNNEEPGWFQSAIDSIVDFFN